MWITKGNAEKGDGPILTRSYHRWVLTGESVQMILLLLQIRT